MQSKTGTVYRVRISQLIGDAPQLVDVDVPQEEFEQFKEDLEAKGGKALRWEPIVLKAIPLFTKEFRTDDGWQELQVVDYGGEFLLRHYIGRGDPKELALGLNSTAATEAYNEYVTTNGFPEKLLVDDLALYLGHTYSHTA